MMDLCLPIDWQQRPCGLFRDDLGPTPAMGVRAVCGLRDWRAPIKRPAQALRCETTATTPLRPYQAPAWLRAG